MDDSDKEEEKKKRSMLDEYIHQAALSGVLGTKRKVTEMMADLDEKKKAKKVALHF